MAFTDFPEQQQVAAILQRSLEQGRLGHAYLFTGTDLGELEAMARTLAKTLNCSAPKRGQNGHAIDCCDRCDSCRRINEDNHPDVFWRRPESKLRVIRIDEIRELNQFINLKPTVSSFKVGIIVAADRLNQEAANAFLKTLEEPPAKSVLILLATEPQRLLETILSRCLRLNFAGERKISAEELAWVTAFAEMAADAKSGLLGRYRLLGVLVDRLGTLREQIDEALTAKSSLERYDELDPKLRDKLEDELKAAIEAEYRRQRADLLLGLELWLRDVWLRASGGSTDLLHFTELGPGTDAVAQRISAQDAIENVQIIENLQRLLSTNIQEALTLEVGFLKLKL